MLVRAGADFDRPTRRGMTQRIVQEIAQDALQTFRVGLDSRGNHGLFKTHRVLRRGRLVCSDGFGYQFGYVDGHAAQS